MMDGARLDKREIRLPDGRRLIFYSFPETTRPGGEAAPSAAPKPPPAGEER